MNFIAQNASRKWANGALSPHTAGNGYRCSVALLLGMPAGPAHAAKAARASALGRLLRSSRTAGAGDRRAMRLFRCRSRAPPKRLPPSATSPTGGGPASGKNRNRRGKSNRNRPHLRRRSHRRAGVALTETIAIAPSIPDIKGAGGCGGEDLVRLEAIVLPDKRRVPVKPAAILRCPMASALAGVDPQRHRAAGGASRQRRLRSRQFQFIRVPRPQPRRRRQAVRARPRQCLDVRAFKFANGSTVSLTDRTVPRGVRESVLHSACSRFSTVLGPGSDGYHEDHIHLDLMERRNNYRICQWDVWDPMPQKPPLLPAERPEEAPPREVAAKPDDAKSGARPAPSGCRAGRRKIQHRKRRRGRTAARGKTRKEKAPAKPALLISFV